MVRIDVKGKLKRLDREEEPEERVNQRRRPDNGPFRLQVDRQTKESYPTFEEAAAVGLAIKKAYPVVQVSVYDIVKSENKIIEVPA
jgi:hypothetical protein